MNNDTYIGLLYKDYAALSKRIDVYAKSAFDDFKLLAVVGAIVGWSLVPERSFLERFLGFTIIGIIVVLLEYRNLLKISMIYFYMSQLVATEQELSRASGHADARSFHIGRDWPAWYEAHHKLLGIWYQWILYAAVIFWPSIFLGVKAIQGPNANDSSPIIVFYAPIYFLFSGWLLAYAYWAGVKLRSKGNDALPASHSIRHHKQPAMAGAF